MTDFEKTGLYKSFAKNKTDAKYIPEKYQEQNLDNVRIYDGFSGLLNSNVVLLDADEETYSEKLMQIIQGEELKCFVTNREGGRGIHTLFYLNDSTLRKHDKVMLACGIVVDFHPTAPYKYNAECLKFKGVERVQVYNEQPYQELPKYFTPLPKYNIDFTNMVDGDSRNSTLFSYILRLQSAGFETEEIRETIRILNKYVLAEPLNEKELEIILRDEAFRKQVFYNGNAFLFDRFAEHIKNTYHVKKINGYLHSYKDGVYVPGYEPIEKLMLDEISFLTKNKRNEVLEYLRIRAEETPNTDLNMIAFKNGVYNLNSDQLEPFNPQYIITNKIPWNYNPDAKSDLVDSTLDKLACGDSDIRYLLEEVAGACLYRSASLGGGKAAILVGDRYNGKSTFIHMIQKMLGKSNYSAADMGTLGNRFTTITLYGKLANIGDDISGNYIPDASTLKKLVTGEVIQAEEKGKQAVDFVSYATHIYSANNIPHIKDPTGAVLRRLLLIPLNGKFTKDTPGYDPFIKYKLEQAEHMEYFIQLALDGLTDVLRNKSFTVPAKVQQQNDIYEVENNPILAFIEEVGKDSIINETTADVYAQYQVFCNNNGFQPGSNLTFSKNINRVLGTKVITGHIGTGKNRKSVKMFSMVAL